MAICSFYSFTKKNNPQQKKRFVRGSKIIISHFHASQEKITSFIPNPETLEAKPTLWRTQVTTDALSFSLISSLSLLHFPLLLNLLNLCCTSHRLTPTRSAFLFTIHLLSLVRGSLKNCPIRGNFPNDSLPQRLDSDQMNATMLWRVHATQQLLHTLLVICSHKKICQ